MGLQMQNLRFFPSRQKVKRCSCKLQEIEKGFHDDKVCEYYCQRYKRDFGQELPDCQFKGNKSKIQSLIRKVHIDADGIETEVQFANETSNDEDFQIEKFVSQKKVVTTPKTPRTPKGSTAKKSLKMENPRAPIFILPSVCSWSYEQYHLSQY